ncbi:hypothetical protein TNIN_184731 [Trichonephila inaurata madagascariensis]|uniref:Uncharacterized protein n=1 Tax=Trichonephila inaurata madagascariensis TaxID=2747483 RepID=A0A8X7CPV6_9ARAC|nr:hypothetical protein TNIN_184731 [Trichonephila inaurata madagascariensis]
MFLPLSSDIPAASFISLTFTRLWSSMILSLLLIVSGVVDILAFLHMGPSFGLPSYSRDVRLSLNLPAHFLTVDMEGGETL